MQNSQTSSFVTNSQTSSFVTNSQTSSFVRNNQTSSFVTNSQTSSFSTGSFTGSFTGSLQGTASYTSGSIFDSNNPALSASYALTASYALSGPGGDGGAVTTYTNGADNRIITSTGTDGITGESNLTFNGITLSVTGNISASAGITGSFTGSLTGNATTATTATTANNANNVSATISTTNTTYPLLFHGSNANGAFASFKSTTLNYNPGLGSLRISSSNSIIPSLIITGSDTTPGIPSISVTTNIVAQSFTGSLLGSASYVTGSVFNNNNPALSASYALTASYALNGGGGPGGPTIFTINGTSFDANGEALLLTGSNGLDVSITDAGTSLTASYGFPTNAQITLGGITGSFTGSLTGALIGTSSWASNSTNSTLATTASSVLVFNDSLLSTNLALYFGETGSAVGNPGTRRTVNTNTALRYNTSTNTITATSSWATNTTNATNIQTTYITSSNYLPLLYGNTVSTIYDSPINTTIYRNPSDTNNTQGSLKYHSNSSSLQIVAKPSSQLPALQVVGSNSSRAVSVTGSLIVSGSNGAGVFSKGGTIADLVNGVSTIGSYAVWRAPFPCQVVAIYGRKSGGSACQVNARKSGSAGYSLHTGSNLVLPASDTWYNSNTVTNTNYSIGDSLEIIISGSINNQVAVQVDFIKI